MPKLDEYIEKDIIEYLYLKNKKIKITDYSITIKGKLALYRIFFAKFFHRSYRGPWVYQVSKNGRFLKQLCLLVKKKFRYRNNYCLLYNNNLKKIFNKNKRILKYNTYSVLALINYLLNDSSDYNDYAVIYQIKKYE